MKIWKLSQCPMTNKQAHQHQQASSEGINVEYSITVQQWTTTALFDTDDEMLVMSQKFFNSLPQKPKRLKPDALHYHQPVTLI